MNIAPRGAAHGPHEVGHLLLGLGLWDGDLLEPKTRNKATSDNNKKNNNTNNSDLIMIIVIIIIIIMVVVITIVMA